MAGLFVPDMDQLTADLIVKLQLEDANQFFASSKGKSRGPTDEELAFQLQQEEAETTSKLLLDRRMARSFATAVQADGSIVANNQLDEETANRDRELALHWTEDGGPRTPRKARSNPRSKPEPAHIDDETLRRLQILYVSGPEDDYVESGMEATETATAESSTWAAQRSSKPTRMHRCIACREESEFANIIRAPCRHEYCRTCVEDLFKASMTDESLFPPRCCQQPITMNIARKFLKSDLVHQYEKKKIEHETPNKTYCSSAKCSAFIEPCHIHNEIARCPDCRSTTCTICKERAHTGDCPADTALQQLLDTARENGWQRCYSCYRVVELDIGCNHMTLVHSSLSLSSSFPSMEVIND